MKKNICVYFILIVMTFLVLIVPSCSFAEDKTTTKQTTSSDVITDFDKYKNDTMKTTKLEGKAEKIVGIIRTIGIVVSVVALMAIGIKYMLGSVEEKAQYKETLKPYIIGAFLVFTVSLLPEIIYQFMKNFN